MSTRILKLLSYLLTTDYLLLTLVVGLSAGPSLASQTEKERAEQLIEEGERLWYLGAFAPALKKVEEALKLSESLSDPKLVALCFNLRGNVSDSQGNYPAGWELHQRALDLAQEINDQRLAGSILADIGLGYWRQADYAQALDSCQRALTIQEQVGDHLGRATTLGYIGRVHFKQGTYNQAVEYHRRALTIQEAAGDLQGQSVTLEDLGDVYQDQGAYAQALESYEHALRIREEMGDWAGQCYMLHIVGRCYMIQGAYQQALDWFRRALHRAQEINDRAGRCSAFYHMGIAYSRQGDYARALECYQHALQLFEELGNRRQQAWVIRFMADLSYRQGDVSQALTRYRRAIEIWQEIQDLRQVEGGFLNMAEIYDSRADYPRALEYYERALRLGEEIQSPYLSLALSRMGVIYAKRGDAELALHYGHRALDHANEENNPRMQFGAAYKLGTIQRLLSLKAEALQSFRDSLAIIERLRAGVVPVDEAKAGFLEDKQVVYADTISLLLELGRDAEALEVAERARARAFLDLLGGRELEAKPTDARILAHIRQLQEALRQRTPVKTSVKGVDQEMAMRGDDLIRIELSNLQQDQSELASFITVQPLARAQLQEEARRRRATLLEYLTTDDQLFIWVVEPDGMIRTASSKITRRDLDQLIQDMRRAMQADLAARDWEAEEQDTGAEAGGSRGPRGEAARPKERNYRSVLRRLYRVLVEPIEPWLPKDPNQLVTIIPHESLFLVSFAALLDRRGRYFIEQHTLNYSPAISVLQYTESKKRRVVHPESPHLLVVGNPAMPRLPGRPRPLPPLAGAETEARAISRLYPSDQVTTLVGARAQERLVRELAPGQTMIHLATHGIIRDDAPLESLLALAPATSNQQPATRSQMPEPRDPRPATRDGLLTMREVFQLDLYADLVVLSACNTGLGQINGDGVIGLSRAFIYAGTPSVMVSLWRVADIVAQSEMVQFYRELKRNGGNKAAALRQAQRGTVRKLRQNQLRTLSGQPLREQPIYWAPFVLIGEAR